MTTTIAGFWARIDKNGPIPAHRPELGPCWLWPKATIGRGYGRVQVKGTLWRVHRFAYTLSHGPIPDGLFVCHRCDVPLCCNPAHLFLGTHEDNMADMLTKGREARGERHYSHQHPERVARGERHSSRTHPERMARGDHHGARQHPERLARGDGHYSRQHPERLARGERHGSALLTESQVVAMRQRYATGDATRRQLADEVGVSLWTVYDIISGHTWQHLL